MHNLIRHDVLHFRVVRFRCERVNQSVAGQRDVQLPTGVATSIRRNRCRMRRFVRRQSRVCGARQSIEN